MSKADVLVVTVTRNNPICLQHQYENIKRFNPGVSADFLIVDNDSQTAKHMLLLKKLAKYAEILSAPNGRAESSFQLAWEKNPDYKYYFLMHDDGCPNKDGWLKVFIDQANNDYVEEIAKNTSYAKLPIGRVGAQHQPWRSYTSMLGYSVQCIFLEHCLKLMYGKVFLLIGVGEKICLVPFQKNFL